MYCSSRGACPRVGGRAAERPLRLAGRARRVDHRGARLVAVGRVQVASVGRCVDQRVDRGHPVGASPSNTRMLVDLGDLAADPLEQRRELGVDVDRRRVAVVDDVGGLLVGQSIVERHGGRADLARGVDHLDEAGRVLPAPHDLVAGPTPWSASTWASWFDPLRVRRRCRCGRRRAVPRSVVDDRRLVRLSQRAR